MVAFIGQDIEYKSQEFMMKLYRTLLWPHLEYCMQFWSPPLQGGCVGIGKGADKVTRREMLDGLGFSLECRRLWGDRMKVYKIMRGI